MAVKKRLSLNDWLDLGLRELSARGAEAVKLDAICAAAKVTKGSFYHHFSNHGAFLVGLTQAWRDRQTHALLPGLEGLEPEDAAEELTALATSIDYRLELGIRELARRKPEVAELVAQTDLERRDALAPIYMARFGCDAEQARRFAWLEYATFSGLILLQPDADEDENADLAAMFDEMVSCYIAKET